MFPIVGRVDPSHDWVPLHYLRYLLSVVGDRVVEALGVREVEVWALRALGVIFRYGVAFAYEGALGRVERRIQEIQDGGSEDLEIDEVRHLDPHQDLGPLPQAVQVPHQEWEDGEATSEWGSSTSASGDGSGPDTMSLGTREPDLGESETSSLIPAPEGSSAVSGGVRYMAEDGALIVVYCDDVMRIPLEGWSFEEVFGIVRSIQEGDWSFFRDALALGGTSEIEVETSALPSHSPIRVLPQNSVHLGLLGQSTETGQVGNEQELALAESTLLSASSSDMSTLPSLEELDTEEPSESKDLVCSAIAEVLDQVGLIVWVIVSGVFLLGCCSLFVGLGSLVIFIGHTGEVHGSEQRFDQQCPSQRTEGPGPGSAVGVLVCASVLHRMGLVLLGLVRDPYRVIIWLPGFGCRRFSVVPVFEDSWWIVWLVLVIIFGLCSPVEAQEPDISVSTRSTAHENSMSQAIKIWSPPTCPASESLRISVGIKGLEWVSLFMFGIAVVVTWEALKRVSCLCTKRRKTVESQTECMNIVPLPLPDGVPCKARVLFCLWQAGFTIDVESYPESDQEEFHGLVGSYLQRLGRDEDLSD